MCETHEVVIDRVLGVGVRSREQQIKVRVEEDGIACGTMCRCWMI